MRLWLIAISVFLCVPLRAQETFTLCLYLTRTQPGDRISVSSTQDGTHRTHVYEEPESLTFTFPYRGGDIIELEYLFAENDGQGGYQTFLQVVYVAEPGEYRIAGPIERSDQLGPFQHVSVEGGTHAQEWFQEYLNLSEEYAAFYRMLIKLDEEEELTEESIENFRRQLRERRMLTAQEAAKIIRTHPDSALSGYLLYSWSRDFGHETIRELYNGLTESVRDLSVVRYVLKELED